MVIIGSRQKNPDFWEFIIVDKEKYIVEVEAVVVVTSIW